MDIQDIQKNVDLTAKQSIEWTVPSVTPCQQIYYVRSFDMRSSLLCRGQANAEKWQEEQLLYWNAGQQVRYTDRFAICEGDVSRTPCNSLLLL